VAEKISREEAERLGGMSKASGPGGRAEDGLEVLGPESEDLVFTYPPARDGEAAEVHRFRVYPMRMRQVQKFLRVCGDLLPALQAHLAENKDVLDLGVFFVDHEDLFNRGLAVALECEQSELGELRPDDYVTLATKVIVVNMDFFVKTLPRVYGGAVLSLAAAIQRYAPGVSRSRS
jgi:hypothetical protein